MADIDLKTETPDTSLPTTGFLFGADSQAAASPSVFTVQSVATTLLGSSTLTGATVTTSSPVIDAAQTWNDGAVTFTGLKLNVTDTASASGSLLMDLQVGTSSRFNVTKTGSLKLGVTASGTNVAGTNVTIAGSQGTGTGAGGSIIFQVAPAGSSGTAQNALATALTIDSTTKLTLADGSFTAPVLGFSSNSSSSGFYRVTTNGFGWSVNGNAWFSVTQAAVSIVRNDVPFVFGTTPDVYLYRDAANTLALRNGTNAQESRVYGSYTSATNFQRMSIKTLRESSGALSGASYTTTIAIPAYANLIGVTTRVTTAVTGATTYDVGDGTDVDLWGAAIGIALGSQSQTSDFTAVAAVGAAATSRTVTLTANGSNFTGGVIEICLHYLTTEAD